VLGHPDVGGTVERTLLANLAGMEMMRCENRERAVGLARRAWEDGEMLRHVDLGDPSLWSVTGALLNSGEIPAVERVLDAILMKARRVGAFDAHATANYVTACVAHARGRLTEAEAACDVALDAHRDGWETFYPAALWVRVQCRLERGDLAGARETVALDPRTEEYWAGSPVALALFAARADIALAEDRPADALALAEAQGRALATIGCRNPLFFGWRACAAIACSRLDRLEDAREHAAADLAAARDYGVPAAIGRALRVDAMLGRPKDAIAVLEAAVAELGRADDRALDLARAHVDLGTALRAAGERVRARESLRTGLDLATRSDATVLAERARDELIAVGGRPRRPHLSGPGSLTPSERRVVDLAVAGRTNRQIAEALFVTRKAVEYHLANAYRKLDVRRRDELEAALGAETLGSAP
jgi:DNA-binding CsgD family transcriptional regulator